MLPGDGRRRRGPGGGPGPGPGARPAGDRRARPARRAARRRWPPRSARPTAALTALAALGRAGEGASTAPSWASSGCCWARPRRRRPGRRRRFLRATIGPVVDYDARRGTALVKTLEAYFGGGRQPGPGRRAAARARQHGDPAAGAGRRSCSARTGRSPSGPWRCSWRCACTGCARPPPEPAGPRRGDRRPGSAAGCRPARRRRPARAGSASSRRGFQRMHPLHQHRPGEQRHDHLDVEVGAQLAVGDAAAQHLAHHLAPRLDDFLLELGRRPGCAYTSGSRQGMICAARWSTSVRDPRRPADQVVADASRRPAAAAGP